jgi:hypothetical protein
MKEDQGAQIQSRRGGVASTFASFWLGTITFLVSLLFGAVPESFAQDVISQEEPTPSSVDEITTPIERSFLEGIRRPGFFPWLKDQLEDTPAFFRDTQLDLNLRSFYFQRDKYGDDVSAAWAFGGALAYKSGWLLDRIQVGTTFYWSNRLARCCSSRVSMVTACWASSTAG